MEKEKKRKIIEIYVTENKEEDTASFEFIKTEDSELANETLKGLVMIMANLKDDEDEIEVEFDNKNQKETKI